MSTGYLISVDPSDLSRFSSHDDPRYDAEDEDPELDEIDLAESLASLIPDGDYESRIVPLLDRIPDREADLITLYVIHKKRQADIATIFGVTQAAVSYRLARGIQRLRFLLRIPQVLEEDMRVDLRSVFPCELTCPKCFSVDGVCPICQGTKKILVDVEILVGMWTTTCQSEVASKLGLTQGRVRHRFFRAVQALELASQQDEKLVPYHQIFTSISSKHFNILREVKLPQWQGRGGDECF